jgi:uncharacterized repeat protein (TIGR01451 family)/CSLREA domain-containing protein
MQRTIRLFAVGFALLLGLPAVHAATFVYSATLSGANENPAVVSPGTGNTIVTLNTTAHTLRVQATFSGLTSNTTAAHIHCCVAPPMNVGVATTTPSFAGFPLGVTSGTFDQTYDMTLASTWNPAFVTAQGSISAAEAALTAGLAAGQAYFNIHTVNNGGGEIRGFLAIQPIVVNSTADVAANDGQCTLREAIIAANSNTASGAMAGECAAGQALPVVDRITFNIPGAGPHTITPATLLPSITETVIIDGGNGGVATNRVELSGGGALVTGLAINSANNSEIRNLVINGFTSREILVIFATSSLIQGNFLGVNAAGTAIVAGSGNGIEIAASGGGHVIGGTSAAARNVISTVGTVGVVIDGGSVTIQGNFIGLNAAGTAVLGNTSTGIQVSNAFATIGGTTAGAGNVIVGFTGVRFGGNPALGHSSGTVQGNFIGTDVTGTVALNLGNGSGVDVDHASGVVINGGNLISGNGNGVSMHSSGISGASSDTTTVQGNFIGTAAGGVTALGNSGHGVDIFITDNNRIGGINAGEGNVIAFNGLAGVRNGSGIHNFILGNSIHSNGRLGIDLIGGTESLAGVTSNDSGDADTGPNNLQNYPRHHIGCCRRRNATISGTLNSTASTVFRLEFFSNAACDASGNGEGQTFIGTANVTTNASGNASFGPLVFAVPAGQSVITSTATDVEANNTSEFSACLVSASADLAVTKTAATTVVAGGNITYTINVTNNGTSAADNVTLTDAVPAGTTFVSFTAPAGWTSTTPAVGGTGTVTSTNPSLASGASASFTLVVNVGAATAGGTVITNTATVASTTTDPTQGNNSATATTNGNCASGRSRRHQDCRCSDRGRRWQHHLHDQRDQQWSVRCGQCRVDGCGSRPGRHLFRLRLPPDGRRRHQPSEAPAR